MPMCVLAIIKGNQGGNIKLTEVIIVITIQMKHIDIKTFLYVENLSDIILNHEKCQKRIAKTN